MPISAGSPKSGGGWQFSGWVGMILRHPYLVAAVPLLLGMAIPFLTRQNSEWDDVFVRAAKHLRTGEGIYQAEEGYVYPPFMAAVALPFTFLPTVIERGIWFLVSAGCLLLLCRWTWRLAGGGSIPSLQPGSFREHVIWLTGLACGFRYTIDCLSHQQNDLFVGALVLGGCLALFRHRALLAATCLGVAAGAKCTPLLWCGYLLYRRQWRAAAWLVVVAVGVNLLPNLIHTPTGGRLWLVEWVSRYLAPMTASTYYPGVWYSEPVYNQSLAGAVNRWFALAWVWTADGLTVINKADPASPVVLKALLYSFELALVLGAMWCLGRRPVRSDAPEPTAPPREVLEYSVVLLLMLLLAPMSSKPHFCTLLLPGFCLARRAVLGRNLVLAFVLVAAVGVGALGIKGLLGVDSASVALWWGNVMWSALFLLLGCAGVLLRGPLPDAGGEAKPLAVKRAA
jgi:Glycosyltransferase family 87